MITKGSMSTFAALALCASSAASAAGAFGTGGPTMLMAGDGSGLAGISVGGRAGPRTGGVAARVLLPRDAKKNDWTLWVDAQQDRLERDGIAFDASVDTESTDTDFGLGILRRLEREAFGLELGVSLHVSGAEREIVDPLVVSGRRTTGDVSSRTVSLSLVGRASPLARSPLRPYGHVGFSVSRARTGLDVDGDGDADRRLEDEETGIEPDVAFGLALPLGRFVLFGALEHRGEGSAVAGLRFEP